MNRQTTKPSRAKHVVTPFYFLWNLDISSDFMASTFNCFRLYMLLVFFSLFTVLRVRLMLVRCIVEIQ